MNKISVFSGTRKTKQRQAILKVLKDTKSHPTTQWIYEQVRQEIPHISLGTVYRDLKLLKKMGEILELDFAGNLTRFDANTSRHYHFYCKKCHRIFNLDEPVNMQVDEKVAAENGFEVSSHRMDFFGFCRECRA